jgi:hypothetical protein
MLVSLAIHAYPHKWFGDGVSEVLQPVIKHMKEGINQPKITCINVDDSECGYLELNLGLYTRREPNLKQLIHPLDLQGHYQST